MSDSLVELMEIRCLYEAERSINVKNCEALKQIADLLSKLVSTAVVRQWLIIINT